jgi:hypothetical protein
VHHCPVSPPDGTARPGQMSDCFLDLLNPPMRVCTMAFTPSAESNSVNKEIIVFNFLKENVKLNVIMHAPIHECQEL